MQKQLIYTFLDYVF